MANITTRSALEGLATLFYLVPPGSSAFKTVDDVPNYVLEATPYFFVLIALEAVIRWLQERPLPRVNDAMSSLTAGTLMTFVPILTSSVEVVMYAWVYQRFRLLDLSWDSTWTWWCAFVAVDFIYYWFHRMAHEVNLFWAAHQVHHSSEEYNLSTALRQSTFQRFTSMFFNLPMALLIPPPAYVVHKEFNLLYQFWIHTEVISNLGPLEWVLNTPSHHRVHHGINPYCIDKNYGGVLIIWDRLFGTFEAEKDRVVYGLVHQLGTWNPLWVQLNHYIHMWSQFWKYGWSDRLSLIWKGPGWSPGKPRLGCIQDIPEVDAATSKPYDKQVTLWLTCYCVLHFMLVLYGSDALGKSSKTLSFVTSFLLIAFFTFSLTSFGLLFDANQFGVRIELLRLLIFAVVDMYLSGLRGLTWTSERLHWTVRVIALVSGLWLLMSATRNKKLDTP